MDQSHRQHQAPRNENDNNIASVAYNINNGQPPHDDYNSYFNIEANTTFNNPYDSPPAIDPRFQPNGFTQTPNWQQPSLNVPSSQQENLFGLQTSSYGNAFSRPQDTFAYSGFHPQQQHFAGTTYDSPLTFGNPTLMNGSGFDRHVSQEYERTNVPSQTIVPSALETFNPYSQVQSSSDGQNSQYTGDSQLPVRGVPGPKQHLYDSSAATSLAEKIPAGSERHEIIFKSPGRLPEAVPENFTGFVYFSDHPYYSEEPRAILPKYTSVRRSMSDFEQQGPLGQSGDGPPVKKVKLSDSKTQHLALGGSSGARSSRLDASSQSPDDSESESSSDYESDSDELEVEEQSPLPAIRPFDQIEALKYDVIKCVWSKRSAQVPATALRSALGEYWKIVKQIRDNWKTETTALQEAEEKKDKPRIEYHQARATDQRNMMETVFSVTLQYGHPDIVKKLPEIPHLLAAFQQLISDRLKDSDPSGSLITMILQFLMKCVTLEQSLLEKTKLDKVLPRLSKRTDEKCKSMIQKILDNAEQYTKQKLSEPQVVVSVDSSKIGAPNASTTVPGSRAGGSTGSANMVNGSSTTANVVNSSTSTARTRPSEPHLNLKRPQSMGSLGPAPAGLKKTTLPASSRPSGLGSAKASVPPNKAVQPARQDSKAQTAPSNNAVPPKVKVVNVTAKPSVFSSLQSASKKPGTSIASQKAASQAETKGSKTSDSKSSASSTAVAAPKPAFSFAETMANLIKPRESPTAAKAVDDRPPETEEEREKRVRKEERRKLRVSFKPDEILVDIRYFMHDPDEELGHDDSMIRDVGDVKGEGRMLKMHKEREILDDDDDESPGAEEILAPWTPPTLVDFTVIDADELGRNCITRGGKVEVKSLERSVQEQRELTTLMVFYSSPSNIPPSPKEPVDLFSGDHSIERPFGAPQEETKLREAQYYGVRNRPVNQQVPSGMQGAEIGALLQALNGHQQPQIKPQPTNPLEAIFAQFSGNQSVPAQPPVPQVAPLDPNIQAALAIMNQQKQAQMNFTAPPVGMAQPQDLQALLAQLGQPPNALQQQAYNYQSGNQSDADRKRQYDHGGDQYSDGKRVRGNSGKKYHGVPRVVCKFWQEGKCKKGDECTFIHEK